MAELTPAFLLATLYLIPPVEIRNPRPVHPSRGVAFDAHNKSYQPADLILLQYHMHIPGPDPLTNSDTEARWEYYQDQFPDDVRGTPTSLFNGKPMSAGGGGMADAEGKFRQYRRIIDPLLEKTTAVKLGGKASRTDD